MEADGGFLLNRICFFYLISITSSLYFFHVAKKLYYTNFLTIDKTVGLVCCHSQN